MIKTVQAMTAADTAYVLRSMLGPKRNWSDFLADCNRGRTSYMGEVLLPVTRRKDDDMPRPVYAVGDIAQFIAAVKAADPTAGPEKVKTFPVEYETDHSPSVRRADKSGRIIKRRNRTTSARHHIIH